MHSQACCPEESWGAPLSARASLNSLDGAKGDLLMIGPDNSLEVYVAKPMLINADALSTKKAILVFTDVFGLQSRLFAICDKLANDLQLYVVAIDCLRGETKDQHPNDFMEWISRHPFENGQKKNSNHSSDQHSIVYPVGRDIEWCLDFILQKFNVKSSNVGGIGFCWGVWALTKACAMGIKFKCGVGFHPSLKFEDVAHKMDQIDMTKSAAQSTPLLFLVAGNDAENLKPPNGEVAQIISSSVHGDEKCENKQPNCVEFPEMIHGWVSRGDSSVLKVMEDAETALNMASGFLKDWM